MFSPKVPHTGFFFILSKVAAIGQQGFMRCLARAGATKILTSMHVYIFPQSLSFSHKHIVKLLLKDCLSVYTQAMKSENEVIELLLDFSYCCPADLYWTDRSILGSIYEKKQLLWNAEVKLLTVNGGMSAALKPAAVKLKARQQGCKLSFN